MHSVKVQSSTEKIPANRTDGRPAFHLIWADSAAYRKIMAKKKIMVGINVVFFSLIHRIYMTRSLMSIGIVFKC